MDNPMNLMILVLVFVFAFIVLAVLLGSFFTINTAERGVVERFNKFSRIAGPGLSLKVPFVETVQKVDMRVQELPFKIETKTKDNVLSRGQGNHCSVEFNILYRVSIERNLVQCFELGNSYCVVACDLVSGR